MEEKPDAPPVHYLYTAIEKKDIKKILHWSEYMWLKRRKELIRAGVIYYQRERQLDGRTILRCKGFPYRIINWIHLKAQKGEKI